VVLSLLQSDRASVVSRDHQAEMPPKLRDLADVNVEDPPLPCDAILWDPCANEWVNAPACSRCVCRRKSDDFSSYEHGDVITCEPARTCEGECTEVQGHDDFCVSYKAKDPHAGCCLLVWDAAREGCCEEFPPLCHEESGKCLILGTKDERTGEVTPCCEGGCIEFCFRCPCVIDEIHLLNIDRCWPPTPIKVWDSQGNETEHAVVNTGQGPGGKGIAQVVKLCVENGKRVKVTLDGQGAVCKIVYHVPELVKMQCCCAGEVPCECLIVDARNCSHTTTPLVNYFGTPEFGRLQDALDHAQHYTRGAKDCCPKPVCIKVHSLPEDETCAVVFDQHALTIEGCDKEHLLDLKIADSSGVTLHGGSMYRSVRAERSIALLDHLWMTIGSEDADLLVATEGSLLTLRDSTLSDTSELGGNPRPLALATRNSTIDLMGSTLESVALRTGAPLARASVGSRVQVVPAADGSVAVTTVRNVDISQVAIEARQVSQANVIGNGTDTFLLAENVYGDVLGARLASLTHVVGNSIEQVFTPS